MKKKRLFFLYPYYWPLYRAGGPTQSLFNLANALRHSAEISITTQVVDVDGSIGPNASRVGQWVVGPNGESIFNARSLNLLLIWRLLTEKKPELVFINGIFHFQTTLLGIVVCKALGLKIVISPRGMLQLWALKRKPIKKKIFLAALWTILRRNECWHATDTQEVFDIHRIFGKQQNIFMAPNIARPLGQLIDLSFCPGKEPIRLVFLSLINPNKNLHLLLQSLRVLKNEDFLLDVYGPVVDQIYWEKCLTLFSARVSYKGAIEPWSVPNILQQYHFFVLPTQGENFGHAIFDSLAAGVPVIISDTTPWNNVDKSNAGFYVDLSNENSLNEVLLEVSKLTPHEYGQLRRGSHLYAKKYLESRNFKAEYNFLFSES